MYSAVYESFYNYAKREGFSSSGDSSFSTLLAILGILLLVIVQLFIVQFLWNTVLVRVVSVVKPLPTLLYTLGLLVLVAMVLPG